MNLETYILIALGIIFLTLIIWIVRLEMKLKKLLIGRSETIDDSIDMLKKQVSFLTDYSKNATAKFNSVDKKLAKTISGAETVRFNPFKGDGSGSNQSFATALINADGDGVVISSLYSRDHISVFGKPIKNLKSEYELSEEEKTALQKAKEAIL
jgi:hypothetical protein